MTVRTKVIGFLLITQTIFCLLIVALVFGFFNRNVAQIEEYLLIQSGQRVHNTIQAARTQLLERLIDYSRNTYSYEFDIDYPDDPALPITSPDLLLSLDFSFMAVVDADGTIVSSAFIDEEDDQIPALMPDPLASFISTLVQDLIRARRPLPVSGFHQIDDLPVIIAAQSVRAPDNPGFIAGYIICGRYIDDVKVERLRAIAGTSLQMKLFGDFGTDRINPSDYNLATYFGVNVPLVQMEADTKSNLAAILPVFDINGAPLFAIRMAHPRSLFDLTRANFDLFLGLAVIFGCLTVLGSSRLFSHFLTRRVEIVSHALRSVAQDPAQEFSPPIGSTQDEIGRLSEDIQNMLSRLREAETRYRTIIDTQREMLCRFRPDGTITFANEAFCRAFNQPSDAIIGCKFDSFITAAAAKSLDDYIDLARQDNRGFSFECEAPLPDNAQKPLWHQWFVLGPKSIPQGGWEYQACGHDITESHEFMEKFETSSRHAQELAVQARTAADAKNTFLANISHEIRTPLNAICGFAELLNESHLESEQKEYVSIIESSGQSLLQILNDILDYAKLEAGKLPLNFSRFSITELVEQVLDLFSQQANEKSISLVYALEQDIPAVAVADSTRIRQILLNLVSNAIKFSAKGCVSITLKRLTVNSGARKGDYLQFHVIDDGPGIKDDDQDRIFEPFTQLENSQTPVQSGTGLGLSLSRDLAKLLGGELFVSSDPTNKGAHFICAVRVDFAPTSTRVEIERLRRKFQGTPAAVLSPSPRFAKIFALHLRQYGIEAIATTDLHSLESPVELLFVDCTGDSPATPPDSILTPSGHIFYLQSPGHHSNAASPQHGTVLAKPVHSSRLIDALSAI